MVWTRTRVFTSVVNIAMRVKYKCVLRKILACGDLTTLFQLHRLHRAPNEEGNTTVGKWMTLYNVTTKYLAFLSAKLPGQREDSLLGWQTDVREVHVNAAQSLRTAGMSSDPSLEENAHNRLRQQTINKPMVQENIWGRALSGYGRSPLEEKPN